MILLKPEADHAHSPVRTCSGFHLTQNPRSVHNMVLLSIYDLILLLASSFVQLKSHWPPWCFSNDTAIFLPQGLCSCYSCCPESSFHWYLPGLVSHLMQVLIQISPSQWGSSWPCYWKLQCSPTYSFSVFCFVQTGTFLRVKGYTKNNHTRTIGINQDCLRPLSHFGHLTYYHLIYYFTYFIHTLFVYVYHVYYTYYTMTCIY